MRPHARVGRIVFGIFTFQQMTPLRFRAWHTTERHMYLPGEFPGQFAVSLEGLLVEPEDHGHIDDGPCPWMDPIQPQSDWIVMQSTGQPDASDTEIFRDDIVEIEVGLAIIDQEPSDSQFFLRPLNEDAWCDDWNFSDDSCRCTVVGNVHANPELLPPQK